MSESGGVQNSLPSQGELIVAIAQAIARERDMPWTSFEYRARMLRPYLQDEVLVTADDGTTAQKYPPDEVTQLVRDLRAAMYRPGAGTWFAARIAVTRDGTADADFDYDNEPEWTRLVEPAWYTQDLEKFPRDDSAIPDWLRARLSEATAGS